MKQKHIKIGELEVPASYFDMDEKDKEVVCLTILDGMLMLLDKNLKEGINRMDVLDKLLQSSILVNEAEEQYEVCAVISKIRELINE
jgi:hypothetical protein